MYLGMDELTIMEHGFTFSGYVDDLGFDCDEPVQGGAKLFTLYSVTVWVENGYVVAEE